MEHVSKHIEEEEKKTKLKTPPDLLQYIDKQSLSYAAVFDLFDSTNIDSDQYSWLVRDVMELSSSSS